MAHRHATRLARTPARVRTKQRRSGRSCRPYAALESIDKHPRLGTCADLQWAVGDEQCALPVAAADPEIIRVDQLADRSAEHGSLRPCFDLYDHLGTSGGQEGRSRG